MDMEVIELKVHLHSCKTCEKAVRKALSKIKGKESHWTWSVIHRFVLLDPKTTVEPWVTCVQIDTASNKITVMGFINRKMVVKAIWKTGRRADVLFSSSSSSSSYSSSSSVGSLEAPSPRLRSGFRCIIPKFGFKKSNTIVRTPVTTTMH